MIHITMPFDKDKRLGRAYNQAFEGLKKADWVCLIDHDVTFLTPDAVNILYKYAESFPDAGIFTCRTNRIHPLAVDQLMNGEFSDNTDMRHHVQIATELAKTGVKTTSLDHVISGFLMMICKKTWLEIQFNEDLLCLGVDNDFSQKVLDSGRKILRMDNLYVWHTYRLMNGISDKTHLQISEEQRKNHYY